MPDCVFCRIAAGEAEASIVLDQDLVMAFMDVRAFHAGHTLIIPKRHIADIYALDDDALSACARVARGVRAAFNPDGMNIWQSTGRAARQEVPHLHFHVLPRFEGDGLLQVYPSRPAYPDRAELDTHAKLIRNAIG